MRGCIERRFRSWTPLPCEEASRTGSSTPRGEREDGQGGIIDGSGASGRDFAGGFYEAAGLVGEQVGAGAARAGDADWGNCARAAAGYGGDSDASGAVFQDECGNSG